MCCNKLCFWSCKHSFQCKKKEKKKFINNQNNSWEYLYLQTSDITKRVIFFSRNQIDIVFNVLSTVPFTFNFICSILAIIHAQNNDYSRAKIFTILIYSTWTIYCIVMAIITAYFGISSLKVFKIHLKNQLGVSNPSVSNIKSSIMRVNCNVYRKCYLLFLKKKNR